MFFFARHYLVEHFSIKSFSIKNFKSYEDATLPISPLTVLIGANASGKSNLLEAIRFLSWLAQGRKLYETNPIIRGNLKNLARNNGNSFSIGCNGIINDESVELDVTLDIRSFTHADNLHIQNEKCYFNGKFMYETTKPTEGINSDISVAYNNFAQGGKKPQIICYDQQAIFGQLISPNNYSSTKAKELIPKVCSSLESSLGNIIFIDPIPNKMRNYSYPEWLLNENGENISGVLYSLWNDTEIDYKTDILSLVQSLPEQNITDIEFTDTKKGEVMIQLIETFGNTKHTIDAESLSDGTLRVLAIAAALLSAPRKSLVIVEEIDNGIHPSRANSLLMSIKNIVQKRELNILISSHNPALLDALPDEDIPNVVFCYRDKDSGASKLLKLGDFDEYVELFSQGTLGQIVTKGTLERVVKNYTTSNDKQQKALEWIESLR